LTRYEIIVGKLHVCILFLYILVGPNEYKHMTPVRLYNGLDRCLSTYIRLTFNIKE